nr:NusG domain II-containing protein [Carnobacterium gallinarum]
MKSIRKQLGLVRPYDIVLVILLMVFSFVPLSIFTWQQSQVSADSGVVAVISIDGKEVRRINLSDKDNAETFTLYPKKGQYNIIEVKDSKIRVKEDNSPDQIAVKTGWISKPGQTSVCLPHKLIIAIESSDPPVEDDDYDTITPM